MSALDHVIEEFYAGVVASAPLVHHFATSIATLTVSEAAVERSFSAEKWFFTATRTQMDDEALNDLLFVKWNSGQLRHKEQDVEISSEEVLLQSSRDDLSTPSEHHSDAETEVQEPPQPAAPVRKKRRTTLDFLVDPLKK